MQAYVSISNFGTDEQKHKLCEDINRVAIFHAYVNDNGVVVVSCLVNELGVFFQKLATDSATNWVEYTVQFDC
jgi:hypothetical protein